MKCIIDEMHYLWKRDAIQSDKNFHDGRFYVCMSSLSMFRGFENGDECRIKNGKTEGSMERIMKRYCAKCKREIEIPIRSRIAVFNMGNDAYGNPNPVVCYACHSEWDDLWRIINRKLIEKNQLTWKEAFERWIGYAWSINAENPNVWSVS